MELRAALSHVERAADLHSPRSNWDRPVGRRPSADPFSSSRLALCLLSFLISLAIVGCAGRKGPAGVPALASTEAGIAEFHNAVGAGDVAAARKLLKEDRSLVNIADNDGGTPLHAAVYREDKAMTELLLSQGANVNAKKNDGWTALHFAAWKGRPEIAQLLLAKGAAVDAKKNDGGTPLHAAVMEGYKAVVELLIAKGADVNAKKADGWTPLRFAALKNEPEIADILRRHGAKE